MKNLKKEASAYTKKMQEELKKMYKGKFKSPMKLPKEDKAKFFKHMDTVWKSKKESKETDAILLAKKVQDYFPFVQDQLKQNYPKGKYKSPMQIEDKAEQKNFHKQVQKLWKKKQSELKEAATVQEEFFKRFNSEQLTELASALEIAKAHGKIKDKVVYRQLLKGLNKALDSDSNEEK